jgi:hypothetical protein
MMQRKAAAQSNSASTGCVISETSLLDPVAIHRIRWLEIAMEELCEAD